MFGLTSTNREIDYSWKYNAQIVHMHLMFKTFIIIVAFRKCYSWIVFDTVSIKCFISSRHPGYGGSVSSCPGCTSASPANAYLKMFLTAILCHKNFWVSPGNSTAPQSSPSIKTDLTFSKQKVCVLGPSEPPAVYHHIVCICWAVEKYFWFVFNFKNVTTLTVNLINYWSFDASPYCFSFSPQNR